MRIRTPLRAAAALTACTALLSACSGSEGYNLTKPPFSASPACDKLPGKVPGELGGHGQEKSGVTGAVVWGDGDIILYCGMPAPDAAGKCRTEGGVGWTEQKPTDARTATVFATHGGETTVQVRFHDEDADTAAALADLSPAVLDTGAAADCRVAG